MAYEINIHSSIKKELYKLVDDCNNESLLAKVKAVLQNDEANDWWNELNEEDQNSILESEKEYENGQYITDAQLMQQFQTWKKK